MRIQKFLASKGYKRIKLVRRSTGDYSVRDSEWNYSDVPHLDHIHTKVDSYTLLSSKKDISNIFLQRVGPLLLPAAVHISHVEAGKHNYVMTILNIIISVETIHQMAEQGCKTTTSYEFFYRGIIGWIVSILAKYATKLNYKTLMAEDMPMRIQRGRLRNEGFKFELDSLSLIGFTDTLDINSSHVNGKKIFSNSDDIIIDIIGLSGHTEIHQFKCTISWNLDTIWVLPMICPHEGANLCFPLSTDGQENSIRSAKCPWHGRQLGPLSVLDRTHSCQNEYSYLHVDFSVKLITGECNRPALAQLILSAKCPKV